MLYSLPVYVGYLTENQKRCCSELVVEASPPIIMISIQYISGEGLV